MLSAGVVLSSAALADGHNRCMGCHSVEFFQEMSQEQIEQAVKDEDIAMHDRYSGLTDEEVQALAEALAED